MILLVDIGNSTTVFGQYIQGKTQRLASIPTTELSQHLREFKWSDYESAVVSSVVPDLDTLFEGKIQTVFIASDTIPILKIDPHIQKDQVGADRLVNALAAYDLCKQSCVVIDSGTATTFCYVDSSGVYQGGAIFPGMALSSKALQLYTAKLPLVWVSPTEKMVGKTTEEAIQIGLFQGFIAMINGMISRYKIHDPKAKIVGTGSGLKVLESQLHLDMFVPDLILNGLALCAQHHIVDQPRLS